MPYEDNVRSNKTIITLSEHFSLQEEFESTSSGDANGSNFLYQTLLGLGMSLFVTVLVIFPLTERITNAKQVQMMTGVSPLTFWLSSLTWDGLMYLICIGVTTIFLLALDEKNTFSTHGSSGTFFFLCFMHGFAAIPFVYLISFYASSPASGFTILLVLNVIGGLIAPITTWLMRQFGEPQWEIGKKTLVTISDLVRHIFSFIPSFPYARGILGLVQVQNENNVCLTGVSSKTLFELCTEFRDDPADLANELQGSKAAYIKCCEPPYVNFTTCGVPVDLPGGNSLTFDCHKATSFYTWTPRNGLNIDIVWLFSTGLFYFILILLIDFGIFKMIKSALLSKIYPGLNLVSELDSDVTFEKNRVEEQIGLVSDRKNQDDILLVKDLCKRYKAMMAVNKLSFGVKNGECFGLLGVNGAGKTTTFR